MFSPFVTPTTTLVDGLSDRARALWAKSGDMDSWLCLPQHMLDSACAAEWLWDEWVAGSVKASLSRLSRLEDPDLRALYIWLAAVHDVGKAQMTFQTQLDARPDGAAFSQRLADAGLPLRRSTSEVGLRSLPHGLASDILVTDWLMLSAGVRMPHRTAASLALIVNAHHGITSDPALRSGVEAVLEAYPPEWIAVQQELLEFGAEVSGIRELLPRVSGSLHAPAQNLLTGLVIMADWMASNTDAFVLSPVTDQAVRTREAIASLDLTLPWMPPGVERDLSAYMREAFGWDDQKTPRPVQAAVDRACRDVDGPALLIIEAPTGEGKTEAALLAVDHLAEACGCAGAVFAAPTMSTADGLFARVRDWAQRATAPGEVTSMFLGHSKSQLNQDFQDLPRRVVGDEESRAPGAGSGTVIASQWMSGRKKGILSNFAVATVDQILLMALQSKHVMLRHLGLVGKVVVIDEVHAYDAYMSSYLQTALQWLARYGVPVVLLSATLPAAQKHALARAYAEQLGADVPDELSTAYPMVTTVSAAGVEEAVVPQRPTELHAAVRIIEDDDADLVQLLEERLAEGGCALIICSTVRRAQQTYRTARERFGGDVVLHHAAFAAADRVAKEAELRRELGPDAHRGAGRPHRRIVVATQVAEQSLDIDADLLVTDIAPIDLLVQRIGRLHRHVRPDSDRPERLRDPEVLVRAVLARDPEPEFEKGTAYIYDEKLLLSTLALVLSILEPHGFRRPDDVAPLVQAAYGEGPAIPTEWSATWERACQESDTARQRSETRARTYRFPAPQDAASLERQFERQGSDLGTAAGEEGGLAQVRDADPTIEAVPILRTSHGYTPLPWLVDSTDELVPDREPPRGADRVLASSALRLPVRFSRTAETFTDVIELLESATPAGWSQNRLLAGQVALPLDGELSVELAGRRLVYSRELGLTDVTDTVEAPGGPPAALTDPPVQTAPSKELS